MTLSSVDLPQPLGPIRQSSSPRAMSSDVSASARTYCVSPASPNWCETPLMRTAASRVGHFGRYASVSSAAMSGFDGSSFVSTNDVANRSSAFGLKCPSRLMVGMVSS